MVRSHVIPRYGIVSDLLLTMSSLLCPNTVLST